MREESGNIAGIREQLITTDKGAVKQCIRNVVTVLENDPKFKGAIRYNMMTDRNDIVKGLGWYRESPALTDSDIDHIMLYLEEHYSLTTEKKIVGQHPICLCFRFFKNLHWRFLSSYRLGR